MKKRLVSAVVCTAMAATMLAGCGSKGGTTEKATESRIQQLIKLHQAQL